MEYEFIHDSTTGSAVAKFSLDHQIIGPWLESEVGKSTEKLTEILTAIDQIQSREFQEKLITGHEYSLMINQSDVQINANSMLNDELELPEGLTEEGINFDTQESANCGVDDFRTLLLSWAKFIKV